MGKHTCTMHSIRMHTNNASKRTSKGVDIRIYVRKCFEKLMRAYVARARLNTRTSQRVLAQHTEVAGRGAHTHHTQTNTHTTQSDS